MPGTEALSTLKELSAAVAAGHADRAAEAALRALREKVPPIELVRAAATTAAAHFDPTLRRPPIGLVALASASNLFGVLQPRFHPLPVLQALVLAASEKRAAQPARPPLIVSGEITHLGRSFLFAARDGNLPEAEAIFLGIVAEGEERRMAGDMLFRAALEDMGDDGAKLVVAVKLWQLARALRFKDARVVLRPAIQYLVAGIRESRAFQTVLGTLGKEWVDLEGLATGGRPLDDTGRSQVSAILAAPDDAACVAAVLGLLREGYAAPSIAEGLSVEASRRVLASKGGGRDAGMSLAFAHAARFVLTFSRSSERLYALFQAALRLRSASPSVHLPQTEDAPGEGEELCHLAAELEARKPGPAANRVASYLRRGFSPARLLDVLANYAARDSAAANEGRNLLMADVCASEFLVTRAPEPAMALAGIIGGSPGDWTAYETWAPLLAP